MNKITNCLITNYIIALESENYIQNTLAPHFLATSPGFRNVCRTGSVKYEGRLIDDWDDDNPNVRHYSALGLLAEVYIRHRIMMKKRPNLWWNLMPYGWGYILSYAGCQGNADGYHENLPPEIIKYLNDYGLDIEELTKLSHNLVNFKEIASYIKRIK